MAKKSKGFGPAARLSARGKPYSERTVAEKQAGAVYRGREAVRAFTEATRRTGSATEGMKAFNKSAFFSNIKNLYSNPRKK